MMTSHSCTLGWGCISTNTVYVNSMRNAKYAICQGDTHSLNMSDSHNGESQADTNLADMNFNVIRWNYNWDNLLIMDDLTLKKHTHTRIQFSILGLTGIKITALKYRRRGHCLILLAKPCTFQHEHFQANGKPKENHMLSPPFKQKTCAKLTKWVASVCANHGIYYHWEFYFILIKYSG